MMNKKESKKYQSEYYQEHKTFLKQRRNRRHHGKACLFNRHKLKNSGKDLVCLYCNRKFIEVI